MSPLTFSTYLSPSCQRVLRQTLTFIKTEHVDAVRPLYQELIEKTRQEELCISYELFVDQQDDGHFVFVEEWPDRAALDVHCATEHFTRLVPLLARHQRQESILLLMDPFGPISEKF